MPQLPEMTDSIEDLLEYFASQPESVKKIVLFEIYGLILADDVIAPMEQNILDTIDNTFGFDASTLATIKGLVKELQDVYDRIYDALA